MEFLRSRRTTAQVSLSCHLYAIAGSQLTSPPIDQSYGQVWPSFSPTKSSQPLLAARSRHQDNSDFHPRPWLPIHQDRTILPRSSAYRPGRTGCLHTSLVGRYQGWGAFGGLSRLMVGISSNLSASPAAEVLSPLNGWVTLERYGQIARRLRVFIYLCNSGLPTQAGIHRDFLDSDPQCWPPCLH